MAWCEAMRVDFVFGLARNPRLVEDLAIEMAWAEEEATRTSQPARRFRDFRWSTLDSWSRRRRVVGKAEWTRGEANPRFIVTSLRPGEIDARVLYEGVYCARGEMENRIMECLGLVRRPSFGGQHAREPAAAVIRLHGLFPPLRPAPHRPCAYQVRRGDLRHAAPGAAEDRRPGPSLRPPHQARHGVGASAPGRVRPRPCPIDRRSALTTQTPQAAIRPANAPSTRWWSRTHTASQFRPTPGHQAETSSDITNSRRENRPR